MASNIEKPYVVGMDIGGTNTVFGIVDSRGNVLASDSVKTQEYTEIDDYVEAVCKKLLPLVQKFGGVENIKGMGVGAPNGNYYNGTIEYAPNLPWKGIIPLAAKFEESLGIPTALTNDANAAAIGEMTYGAARGLRDFIMITLGTGVGSGIVIRTDSSCGGNINEIFVALALGLVLLNWIWQLFKNYFAGIGVEAEDPIKLSIMTFIFIFLIFYANDIVNLLLDLAGTPYSWILSEDLPPLEFGSFNSVITVILGVCANGAVAIIALILVLILAWNYIKLLFEAAERYILLGVLVYTAPVAFATGASKATSNIFKSWCRMLGGQFFLLLMNAWCLRLFTTMVGTFLANPLSL